MCVRNGGSVGWRWNRWTVSAYVYQAGRAPEISGGRVGQPPIAINASTLRITPRFLDVHHLFLLLPFLREPPAWRTDTTITAITTAIADVLLPEEVCTRSRFVFFPVIAIQHCTYLPRLVRVCLQRRTSGSSGYHAATAQRQFLFFFYAKQKSCKNSEIVRLLYAHYLGIAVIFIIK